jgi:hypothetical protein
MGINWGAIAVAVLGIGFLLGGRIIAVVVKARYARGRSGRTAAAAELDGWQVVDASDYRFFAASAPPRRWTLRQQLAADVRSPVALAFWSVALAGNAVGFALQRPALYCLGLAAAGILVYALPHTLRMRRDARVVRLRATRIDGPALFGTGYAVPAAAVADLPNPVGFKITVPWVRARTIVDQQGSVELLVVVEGKSGRAIGLRSPG